MNKFCTQTTKNINSEIKILEIKQKKLTKLSEKVAAFHKDLSSIVKKTVGCLSVEVMDIDYYTSCWADSVDEVIEKGYLYTDATNHLVSPISETAVIVRPVENKSKPNPAFIASNKDYEEVVLELTKPLVKKHFNANDHIRVLFCWSGC